MDSVESVGINAFAACPQLRTIVLPESVKGIGDMAFADCPLLESVLVFSMNDLFGANVFTNTPKLTLFCYADSDAELYAITNEIPYMRLGQGGDTSGYALDKANSVFIASSDTIEIGEPVNMTLHYVINEDVFEELSNLSLRISFNSVLSVVPETLALNEEPVVDYSLIGKELFVPVVGSSGTLCFTAVPNEASYAAAFAQLSFTYKEAQRVETIGTVYLNTSESQDNGFQIRYLGTTGYSASALIRNGNSESATVTIAAAIYNTDGYMTSLNMRTIQIPAGGGEAQMVECDPNAAMLRVFVLDPETLIPLCRHLVHPVF
jgi:hypothetical protein